MCTHLNLSGKMINVQANIKMTYSIRKYKETDLSAVLSSWESANAVAHPFLDKAYVAKVRHDIPALYLPNAETWVSEYKGRVIGFIALMGNEIGAIFVDKEFHGMGVGKALMDKARSLHATLEVEVFTDNVIGRKFYSSYGFKFMHEKTHEETGEQLLQLMYSD